MRFGKVTGFFGANGAGKSSLLDLLLDEWGEIENWPENFFGDEMGEIAAIAGASLRRRMERSG